MTFILALYVWIAVLFDWKFYRIPNLLCLSMAATGIFFSYLDSGVQGIGISFLGMMEPIVILYLLFYCHFLGAGDIKLLAAIGTFVGIKSWKLIVLSFVLNGFGAFIKLQLNARFTDRYYYMKGYFRDCKLAGKLLSDYQSEMADRIHFSIGIFLAVLFWVIANKITG